MFIIIIGSKFVALVIPSSPGALFDLVSNQNLSVILNAFIRENSKTQHVYYTYILYMYNYYHAIVCHIEPICAVGYGVCGLFSTLDGLHSQQWSFKQHSLTGVSEYIVNV